MRLTILLSKKKKDHSTHSAALKKHSKKKKKKRTAPGSHPVVLIPDFRHGRHWQAISLFQTQERWNNYYPRIDKKESARQQLSFEWSH